MPGCFVCKHSLPSISALSLHFKLQHKLTENITYRCNENDCLRSFANLKSFKNHLRSKHYPTFNQSNNVVDYNPANNRAPSPNSLCDNSSPQLESSNETNTILNEFKNLLNRQTMTFVAQLYDSSLLPRNAVQQIIDFIKEYLESGFVLLMKKYILQTISSIHLESPVINDICFMFDSLISPFDKFGSEYLRFKEFEESKFLIKPTEYIVGKRHETCKVNDTVSLKTIDVTAQFVPLRTVFTELFKTKNFVQNMLSYIESLKADSNAVSNIFQSSHFKNIQENIGKEKLVLPLCMYYDDYESGNPLGSHSGVHKLGAVYVSILVFPPKYRSTLSNIFMALLFHANDRKEFGNAAVFNILIKELKYLEENGISVTTENGSLDVYFALTLILGDNLGLHSVLGFVESFNSNFSCRFCKADKETVKTQTSENIALIRTQENYKSDIAYNDVSKTGIKELCIFNSLKFMHAVTNYSVDIMHDLYEGVCHYDMLHILKYLIFDAGYFSLDTLNARIDSFNYCFESSNKPPLLQKDFQSKKKISMSASEMLCFVRYFGLFIGDLVPENDDVWLFFLVLRNIITLVTSQNITENTCRQLQFMISKHNSQYQLLFKDTLKPKHHHLIHYASIMRKVGPLEQISSMRYEAKHRQSKMTANVTCSRRNITKSLALKHQLQLSYRLLSNEGFQKPDVVGPSVYSSYSEMLENYDFHFFPATFQDAFIVKWVTIGGFKFKQSSVIVVEYDMLPKFGVIETIVVNSSKDIGVVYLELKTISFNEHLYAYEVEQDTTKNFIHCGAFFEFPLVLMTRMSDSKCYIAMRNPI